MKVLKARNEGKTKVLNKSGKIVLKKDRYKKGDVSKRKISHS